MVIKLGDLFELGEHRLSCGDAQNPEHFEMLMGEKKAILVCVDPPYGVNYTPRLESTLSRHLKDKTKKIVNDNLDEKSFGLLLKNSLNNLMQYSEGAFYVFMSTKYIGDLISYFKDIGGAFSGVLVAAKSQFALSWGNYHPKHELILYGWKKQGKKYWCGSRKEHSLLEFQVAPCKLHPTMKPLGLLEKLVVNSSPEGGLILDCFAGSGSTIIAAHNQKRICYAMEITPEYCQVILERFQKHTGIEPKKLN